MPILTLSHLSYTYEGERSPVFENLNYSFEEGRIYAVVGRSGAGKTTLLSLLSGLTRPTGGTSLDWTEKRTGEAVCAALPVRFFSADFLRNRCAAGKSGPLQNTEKAPEKQ